MTQKKKERALSLMKSHSKIKRKIIRKRMELTLKESQKLKFKSLILPSDWEDLDKWVDSLAKTLRSNYSKETLREYDRAVGWRAGMKRGWDNAFSFS